MYFDCIIIIMNNTIQVPISVGELCDKYTILTIKQEKIDDTHKLIIIEKELFYLESILKDLNIHPSSLSNLKQINTKLWGIEDDIRIKESKKEFDEEFIKLARLVYYTNDERFELKNIINNEYGSDIFEVKSYTQY